MVVDEVVVDVVVGASLVVVVEVVLVVVDVVLVTMLVVVLVVSFRESISVIVVSRVVEVSNWVDCVILVLGGIEFVECTFCLVVDALL